MKTLTLRAFGRVLDEDATLWALGTVPDKDTGFVCIEHS